MTTRLYSDLHLEFHSLTDNFEWLSDLPIEPGDVAVFAGDITSGARIAATYTWMTERWAEAHIIVVAGNHEYYGVDRLFVSDQFAKLAAHKHPNLHVLGQGVNSVIIDDQRYHGHTMWYPPTKAAIAQQSHWSDFSMIRDASTVGDSCWFYAANRAWRDYLEAELDADDIVITHMLPSYACVAPRWRRSDYNCFFVSSLDDLILDRKPRAVAFGHTHESIVAKLGSTQLLSNPCGYLPYEPNSNFDITGYVGL